MVKVAPTRQYSPRSVLHMFGDDALTNREAQTGSFAHRLRRKERIDTGERLSTEIPGPLSPRFDSNAFWLAQRCPDLQAGLFRWLRAWPARPFTMNSE